MDAILLNSAWNSVDMGIEHGQQDDMIFRCDLLKDGIELVDVVGTVVGWQRDPREDHLAACFPQGRDDRIEIGAGRRNRKTAQTVVAAKLDDNHRRMELKHLIHALNAVLGGISAHALIDDPVSISASIQISLQVVWIAVARIDPMAGCNTVTEANNRGKGTVRSGMSKQRVSQQCGEERQELAAVHNSSVATASVWSRPPEYAFLGSLDD